MKKLKLVMLAILAAAIFFPFGGCLGPLDPIADIDDPVVSVPTIPVAAFSYYCDTYPIQTDSVVIFSGSDSYDPDGEIVWGEWDFGDGTVIEGVWTKIVQRLENGIEVFETESVYREKTHPYMETPQERADRLCAEDPDCVPPAAKQGSYYTVTLTVWDDDGNKSATSRQIKMQE